MVIVQGQPSLVGQQDDFTGRYEEEGLRQAFRLEGRSLTKRKDVQ